MSGIRNLCDRWRDVFFPFSRIFLRGSPPTSSRTLSIWEPTLNLIGPLSNEEMVRVRQIGDYVHDHYKKLIFG
jgi:hypothetical protein